MLILEPATSSTSAFFATHDDARTLLCTGAAGRLRPVVIKIYSIVQWFQRRYWHNPPNSPLRDGGSCLKRLCLCWGLCTTSCLTPCTSQLASCLAQRQEKTQRNARLGQCSVQRLPFALVTYVCRSMARNEKNVQDGRGSCKTTAHIMSPGSLWYSLIPWYVS